MGDLNFSITEGLYDDLSKYASRVAYNLAVQTSYAIEKEYESVIKKFYSEYTPKRYIRHADRPGGSFDPGLTRTYRRFVGANARGYFGGIDINSDDMYTDYNESNERVLQTFLDGYHGHEKKNILSDIDAFHHMDEYVQRLVENINKFVPKAKQYASSFPYRYI